MNLVRSVLLLGSVMFAGCNTVTVATPVVSLAGGSVELETQSESGASASAKTQASKSAATEPIRYTVRKAAIAADEPSIPRVLLTVGHSKLCQVKVGDAFPKLSLPRLGGPTTDLTTLLGKQATLVLFWHPDRWMARTALIDMQRDVASQFAADQVSVVGVAVREPTGAVQAALNKAQATFPQLLDTDGRAFAQVGTAALPRIYVLDPAGKIVWFDIEYSEGTRRDLWQTLAVLTKSK